MSERSFPPTRTRLLKARREGKALKSGIVTTGASLTIGICLVLLGISFFRLPLRLLLKFIGGGSFANPTGTLKEALILVLILSLVSITPCAIVGAFTEGAQLGFRIFFGSGFKSTGRLSVVSGVKRLWSGLTGLWLQAIFLTSSAAVLYWFLKSAIFQLSMHVGRGYLHLAMLIAICEKLCGMMIGWLIVCATIEYCVRRFQYLRSMRMTHEELKEELKESEGNAHIRAYRRSLQRTLAVQDIETRVRKAKVIVVERACSQTEHLNL